jgi:hypothetical protein
MSQSRNSSCVVDQLEKACKKDQPNESQIFEINECCCQTTIASTSDSICLQDEQKK